MKKKLIVIKLGTSSLTGGSNKLDQSKIIEIVRQCHELTLLGHQIIIVTSGSIAAGREILNYPDLPKTVASKQLLAAVGQGKLIRIWEQLFSIYHHNIGQVLLTRADMEDKERFLNAQDALKAMLSNHIIPVINENDVVATAEIKVGDNDNLSALAAVLSEADQLILLTDQQGLFTADPRSNPDAKLIQVVEQIDDDLRAIAGDSISGLGTGGMSTKLQAAEIATRAGIEVVIASAERKNVIVEIANDQPVGTKFLAKPVPLEHRKHWLFAAPSAGKIFLDDGATLAIRNEGRSILPKGITSVEGLFSRGDVVDVFSENGRYIARGVTRYNSDAIGQIAGHHSQEIASLIGYEYGFVVIHRNDMILK